MKKSVLLVLSCLLLSSSVSLGVERVPEPKKQKVSIKHVFSDVQLDRIDQMLARAIEREAVPFAACYVQYKDEVVYYKSFGWTDQDHRQRLKRDAIFRIASQTKLITTVALMSLYEEGLFRLDDPIKKYLPEFSNPVVRVSGSIEKGDLITRPAKGDITIRQLLSHTSGISYHPFDQDVRIICYPEQDTTVTTEEVVRRIAKLPLQHDPGKGFTYGFSLDVAGRLAEVISGKRLDVLIKERVLDPLDMKDTYFYLPQNKASRLVPLYQKPTFDSPVMFSDSTSRFYPLYKQPIYFGGGAGMSGTIEDYAHLCQMIRDKGVYKGRRVLSRKVVEQMCTDQLMGVAGDFRFGLGLEITNPVTAARTMKSVGSLRWGGYYGTEYLIDPKEDLVMLFYTNKESWYTEEVAEDFIQMVYMSLL